MKITKEDLVAVVMGGPSEEREISRVTGGAIAEALQSKGYNIIKLELEPSGVTAQLQELGVKAVFNAVHGMYGEDGRLQSLLEAAGIPYTGCGVLASAVSMDKAATKRFLLAEGISTPKSRIFSRQELEDIPACVQRLEQEFSLPVVVKAAAQGSSIGVEIVRSKERLAGALTDAAAYSAGVLAEEFISGRELTVAVMERDGVAQALPVILIAPHSGAYDFHSKYTKGATDYLVPAPLTEEVTARMQQLALQTYRTLGLSGVARIDIILDDADRGYVLEANTVPGMTPTSLVPKAARAVGMEFPELCELILQGAHN